MALAKLVLTPVATIVETSAAEASRRSQAVDTIPAPSPEQAVDAPAARVQPQPAATSRLEAPERLLPTARFVVVNHEQHTGQPITVDELADRLNITPAVAGQLLSTINPPATVPVRINGAPVLDGVR